MKPIKIVLIAALICVIQSCKSDKTINEIPINSIAEVVPIVDKYEFGYNLNDYIVIRDTIKKGDSFGQIMERNKIGYPQIYNIVEKIKDTFNIAKLQQGRPYTLLCSKDSLQLPTCFIYQPDVEDYVVINFQDSIHAYSQEKTY